MRSKIKVKLLIRPLDPRARGLQKMLAAIGLGSKVYSEFDNLTDTLCTDGSDLVIVGLGFEFQKGQLDILAANSKLFFFGDEKGCQEANEMMHSTLRKSLRGSFELEDGEDMYRNELVELSVLNAFSLPMAKGSQSLFFWGAAETNWMCNEDFDDLDKANFLFMSTGGFGEYLTRINGNFLKAFYQDSKSYKIETVQFLADGNHLGVIVKLGFKKPNAESVSKMITRLKKGTFAKVIVHIKDDCVEIAHVFDVETAYLKRSKELHSKLVIFGQNNMTAHLDIVEMSEEVDEGQELDNAG